MSMTFNEFQALAQRTENKELTPFEHADNGSDGLCGESGEKMSATQFARFVIGIGWHVGIDGHIRKEDGSLAGRMARNGYFTVRKEISGQSCNFMEHRIVWAMTHDGIDDNLVINHINFDRADNRIDNLELVTQKENIEHAKRHGRLNPAKGERSGKAILTNEEAQLIRHLRKNGYSQRTVKELFNLSNSNMVSRVFTGARYGSVPDAADFMAIYPLFVQKQLNHGLCDKDILMSCLLGLAGESGEVVDLFKKTFFHGHEYDEDKTIDELGDVLFYLVAICNIMEIDFAEVYWRNVDKLKARYPDGFSAERSLHRDEKDKFMMAAGYEE